MGKPRSEAVTEVMKTETRHPGRSDRLLEGFRDPLGSLSDPGKTAVELSSDFRLRA
jgi:hypothetical protein